MIREWANKDQIEDIEEALQAPASWRDPLTGLPAGWVDDEASEWAEFERQMTN